MDDVEAYIRSAAAQRGINPDTAVGVAKTEGLGAPYKGDQGTSFGPFQLHYGGMVRGGNSVSGLGDDFTAATGLHASDPNTVKQQIDFALDHAAANGWGAWHGWKGDKFAGIGGQPAGLNSMVASASPQTGAPAASVPGVGAGKAVGGLLGGDQLAALQNIPGMLNQGQELQPSPQMQFAQPSSPGRDYTRQLIAKMLLQKLAPPSPPSFGGGGTTGTGMA